MSRLPRSVRIGSLCLWRGDYAYQARQDHSENQKTKKDVNEWCPQLSLIFNWSGICQVRLLPFGSEGAAASCDLSRFEGSMTEQPDLCVCVLPEAGAQLVRGF